MVADANLQDGLETILKQLDEYKKALETMKSAQATPRPVTSHPQMENRQRQDAAIVARAQARANAQLAKGTDVILRLPVEFLRRAFDDAFPVRFRQITRKNPVGCWFVGDGDNQRSLYQQKNFSRTTVPAGALGNWVMGEDGKTVIGAQPRQVRFYNFFT